YPCRCLRKSSCRAFRSRTGINRQLYRRRLPPSHRDVLLFDRPRIRFPRPLKMRQVISVPPTLDERGFDAVVAELGNAESSGYLLDGRHVRWADPYGMVGLLAVGHHLSERDGV